MAVPTITKGLYQLGIEMTDAGIGVIAAPFLEGYSAFWSAPIEQAPILNEQARLGGMTAATVFQAHAATVEYLMVAKPDILAGWTPPPIAPNWFTAEGDIDVAALTIAWTEYQQGLAPPQS